MELVGIVLASIFGGSLLTKLTERLFSKKDDQEDNRAELRKLQLDENAAIRNELRDEVGILRKEIRDVDAQLDQWRQKYHELAGKYDATSAELAHMRKRYFELMQDHQAMLLEVEVLRRILAKHGFDVPDLETYLASASARVPAVEPEEELQQ